MVNSTFKPNHRSQFQADWLKFDGKSAYAEAQSSEEKNSDLVLTDDVLLTGGYVCVQGGKFGDKICLQVVHPQAGVLDQFVSDYYIKSDSESQFSIDLDYPAKLPAGLIVRAVYKSNNNEGLRRIAVNYFLHKVLI